MDQFGPLPLTVAGLDERLHRGETFVVEGVYPGGESFDYVLSFDGGGKRYILRQGSTESPFRQLESALLTLLCCLGEFRTSEQPSSRAAEE